MCRIHKEEPTDLYAFAGIVKKGSYIPQARRTYNTNSCSMCPCVIEISAC